jgi:hypothetical protein
MIVSNAADRQLVVERHEKVLAADRAVEDAKAALAEVKARGVALDLRATQHGQLRPLVPAGPNEQIAAAIAADPTYVPDPAVLADAARQRASAEDAMGAWQAEGELIEQAKPHVAADISAADDRVRAAKAGRVEAWEAFVPAAHSFLLGELSAALAPIVDDIFTPLIALSALEAEAKGPLGVTRQLVPPSAPRVVAASVQVRSMAEVAPNVFMPAFDKLVDLDEMTPRASWASDDPALVRFRASLQTKSEVA